MIFNYYSKLKQLLQQDNHDLDLATNDQFIRIIPNEKKWENDQWKEYIQNVDFQYMDRNQVLSQLKRISTHLQDQLYILGLQIKQYLPQQIISCLLKIHVLKITSSLGILKELTPIYSFIKVKENQVKSMFKGLLNNQTAQNQQLMKNYQMTFSLNQRRLFYLLRAYANQDPSIGYVQGMNYIMGLLLFLLDDSNSLFSGEMKAYQMFLFINVKMNWSQTYNKSMKKLKSMVQHVEVLLQQNLPDINHLYFYGLILFGLMSYKTPLEFSAKILDIFIIQGEQIIFDVLLRVFTLNRNEIKQLYDKDEQTQFIKEILPMSIENLEFKPQFQILKQQSEDLKNRISFQL